MEGRRGAFWAADSASRHVNDLIALFRISPGAWGGVYSALGAVGGAGETP